MKKVATFIVLLSFISCCYCQNNKFKIHFAPNIPVTLVEVFTSDVIWKGIFIGDTSKRKPLIVFCQGSGPIPLFVNVNDSLDYFTIPEAIFQDTANFHYAVLSKPGIPLNPKLSALKNYQYLSEKNNEPPKEYIQNSDLQSHVDGYSKLINQLVQKTYIDTNKIVIVGHSQGARVATKVIQQNNSVSHLVYLSCDPLGRMYFLLEQSESDPDKLQLPAPFNTHDSLSYIFNRIIRNPTKDSLFFGESYQSWLSYAEVLIDDFMDIHKPVFIGYGKEDNNCPHCELFKIIEATEKKLDLNIVTYPNYDHNFFDVNEQVPEGKRRRNNWAKVMRDVYIWLSEN